jgi:phosphoribosylanthranilate isomerase
LDTSKLKEMIDWVEGPQVAGVIDGLSLDDQLQNMLDQLELNQLIIGPFIDASELNDYQLFRMTTLQEVDHVDENQVIIILEQPFDQLNDADVERIKETAANKSVYLSAAFEVKDLDVLETLGIQGIVLKGGEEEKVGYKSFESLDDILEHYYYD